MGVMPGVRAFGLHAIPDFLHGEGEVLVRSGPARRKQPRIATQRLDAQAAIVGQRRQSGQVGGLQCLQFRIGNEGRAGFFRFGQVERGGGDRIDTIGAEQRGDFTHLARIVTGDHQLAGGELADGLFLSELVGHYSTSFRSFRAHSINAKVTLSASRLRSKRTDNCDYRPVAASCAAKILAQPIRARRSRRSSSSSS